MSVRKFHVAAMCVAASIAAPAAFSAPILNGGDISNDWLAPTQVASGTTDVTGSGMPEWMGGNRHHVFLFSGLTPGASSIVAYSTDPGHPFHAMPVS